jgi:hypothetical protein
MLNPAQGVFCQLFPLCIVHFKKSKKIIIPSSGLLGSVGWLSTDVSGQLLGPNFKDQVSKKKSAVLEYVILIGKGMGGGRPPESVCLARRVAECDGKWSGDIVTQENCPCLKLHNPWKNREGTKGRCKEEGKEMNKGKEKERKSAERDKMTLLYRRIKFRILDSLSDTSLFTPRILMISSIPVIDLRND